MWSAAGSGAVGAAGKWVYASVRAYVILMAQQMPIYSLGQLVGEHDTRLWRLLHHYVDCAREQVDMSATVRVGMDETSKSRGMIMSACLWTSTSAR